MHIKQYQAGVLTIDDYVKHDEHPLQTFNNDETDTWFLSNDAPEIVIRCEGKYFLMTDTFQIIELIIKPEQKKQ